MRSTRLVFLSLFLGLAISIARPNLAESQESATTAAATSSTLTPEQRALFDEAGKEFNSGQFADALPKLRQLHDQVPANNTITKFTAEAAVNTGDFALASSLLGSILASDPDDPQALGIQAHLYGQQHEVEKRDAVLDHLQKLHDAHQPVPPTVIVEKDPIAGGGFVRICDYLEPWSRFHIVLLAEFYDSAGQRTHRVALESDDIDQVNFAREHPDQAATGVRIYSMDSYAETRNADGKVVGQVHGTLCPAPGCFMTGRPTYEFFREAVLNPKAPKPISTTTIPVKPPN